MQFPLISFIGALAPFALRYSPFRPIAPTPGLSFILLSVGGLGGYFALTDIAEPGSWPAFFTVLAGICLAALLLMNWMLAARLPDESANPVGRVTQNIVLTGFLLLFLTPYPSLNPVEFWVMNGIAWLQLLALLSAICCLTMGRLKGGQLRRLALLLPLLVLAPAAYFVLTLLQGPLVRGLVSMAPSFNSDRVGFSPVQFLDHKAFLTPSTRPVMRIQASYLPSRYLVGNRMVTMNGASMSWDAGKGMRQIGSRQQKEDESKSWFFVSNHHLASGDISQQPWNMKINSLRWDRLVFLPPSVSQVAVEASHLRENQHRVWEAEFEANARKEWLAVGGESTPDGIEKEYLQLPTFWDAPLQAKADSLKGVTSEATAANIMAEYFGRGYTLEVNFDGRKPFHDFFLNEAPAYCFWYATGAALALRANGIPSRLASGYLINEQLTQNQWLVRERDAHSWVEWQDSQGYWRTLDPTPPTIGDFFGSMPGSEFSRYYHRFVLWWQNTLDSVAFAEDQENGLIILGFVILAFLFVREYLRIRARESTEFDGYSRRWRRVWRRFLVLGKLEEKKNWSAERYADNLPTEWGKDRTRLALAFLGVYEKYRFSRQEPPFAEIESILNNFKKTR